MKPSGLLAILLLATFLLSGCKNEKQIRINGQYHGEKEDYIKLSRLDVDKLVFIDSVRISGQGSFSLKFKSELPDFYTIGFDNSEFVTVIAYPGDKINLVFNGANLQDNYTVDGSKESADILKLDKKLEQTLASMDSLSNIYDAITDKEAMQSRTVILEEQYQKLIEEQRLYNIEYIIENLSSFASIKAIYQRLDNDAYVLYKETDAQFLKLVSDTLNAYYPGSRRATTLARNLESELSAMRVNRLTALAANAESRDMDIELESINGKNIKLSSLRKKSYVLLSFWSAQSKECIANNLQMKDLYKKYHNSGFEIYQVNVDENENIWKQSVQFDELPWINVRETDPLKPENALKYNVTSIPANYLIDLNGEIIGKDLFGRALQIKLNQLFD